MADGPISRRRALSILAGAALATTAGSVAAAAHMTEWRGIALGADARILLGGQGRVSAATAIADCIAEIERLETIFSLYRSGSELLALNETGRTEHASLDLRLVLQQCADLHRSTEGLFDPTVQPLWRLYADWFAGRPDRAAPDARKVAALVEKIGMQHVASDHGRIRLSPGCQLTLNGIAQGYITDRIAELLRARGWSHVLADIGEVRVLAERPDGSPFEVLVRESGLGIALVDAALATSSPDALLFSADERLAHIINPRNGRTASPWRCITVRHASAMVADGLSTALVLASASEMARIARRVGGVTVWATQRDGATEVVMG